MIPSPLSRQALWASLHTEQAPDTRIEMVELRSRLAQAAEVLTLDQNLVIYGIYFDRMTQKDLAIILGYHKSNVTCIRDRALALMRKALFPLRFRDLMPGGSQ